MSLVEMKAIMAAGYMMYQLPLATGPERLAARVGRGGTANQAC